ncbi:MAG TPA: hypothetical protein VGJ60_15750 [Chloroflexota bacterium]|jgi:hypothetical protein
MHENHRALSGRVTVYQLDTNGSTVAQFVRANTIVDAGRALIGQRLIGNPAAGPISHLAVGSSNAAATPSDTGLRAEINSIARTAITTQALPDGIGLRVGAQVSSATSQTISEAGLFNAAAHGAGVMYNRVTFSAPIPIAPGLDLAFQWDITF